MTIKVRLSTESIDNAISKLTDYLEEFEHNAEELIDVLVTDGAAVAQAMYGGWDVEAIPSSDGMNGRIDVVGDMPAIAEFGAGSATEPVGFENMPDDVYEGSYSEEHAQQYSRFGVWFFGGQPYTEVPPHHGLLAAKEYIIAESTNIAREVFGS